MTRGRWALLPVLLGLALARWPGPVAAKGPKPIYPIVEEALIGGEIGIRVPAAKVVFEIAPARRKPPKRMSSELEVGDWLRWIASDTLRQKNLSLREDPVDEQLTRVTRISDRLVRSGSASETARDLLRRLGGEDAAAAVLVQYLKVEIGPEGSYNPTGGSLALELKASTLRAALIRCESGEVVWRGEMFIRDLPRVEDANFRSAVAGLYDGLSLEGGSNE